MRWAVPLRLLIFEVVEAVLVADAGAKTTLPKATIDLYSVSGSVSPNSWMQIAWRKTVGDIDSERQKGVSLS